MPPKANTYSGPIETSIPYRPIGWPKMFWTSPNGSSAIEATAVRIATIGAIRYR